MNCICGAPTDAVYCVNCEGRSAEEIFLRVRVRTALAADPKRSKCAWGGPTTSACRHFHHGMCPE